MCLVERTMKLPRHCMIKERISELNRLWHIRCCWCAAVLGRTIGGTNEHTTPPDDDFKMSKVVRVKLSGDGTTIGK